LPPGTRVALLPLRLNRAVERRGWLRYLAYGQPSDYRLVPLADARVELRGDSLYFRRFAAGTRPPEAVHALAPFAAVDDSVRRVGTSYVFTTAGVAREMAYPEIERRVTSGPLLEYRSFPLGTDKYGRCLYSRLLLGFRVSLTVGAIAVVLSLVLGLLLGALGGYLGGRTDDLVMLLVNTVWSIPTLLLVFAIVLALGRGIGVIFVAVGLTMWVDVARIVRGQVLVIKALPFVEAARSLGASHARIIWRHVLPNLVGPVLVVTAGNFATAILIESGLSYLGFGVQPPAPSWGTLLYENYGYALAGKPLLALAPAMVIALTVLAFNLVGNALRDAADVRGG
jgi:peptide/nickel transport system permease protein